MEELMLAPFQVCEIARLIAEGFSNRQISRVTGASRASVARYRKVPDRGMNAEVRRRPRDYKLDAGDQSALANLVSKARGNCSIVCNHIKADPKKYGLPEGFDINQRSVRRYAVTRFPELFADTVPEPVTAFHCQPGQQLQIDFIHCKFRFDGADSEETIYIFEAVYPWSRKAYVRVCPDMTQASWLLSIADCLANLGIPRQILCDNDKGLVLENNRRKKTLRFHPAFEWLCKPLGISPLAARPARPQTKGRVERFGGYIKINGLIDIRIDRLIHNRQELQEALSLWVKDVADKRVFKVEDEPRTVAELYEKEKPLLKFPALLKTAFDIITWTTQVTKSGGVNIYGIRVQLDARMAEMYVYVSLRTNGEYLISAGNTKTVKQGQIPPENMHQFKRDESPSAAPIILAAETVVPPAQEIADLVELFGEHL
jgi:transposase